jgi:hypothetical protein
MTDQSTLFERLRAPFPADRVSWRVGNTNQDKTRGMAFAYIDARDVMDRLDEVCGPANWQCRYPHANGKTVCELGLRVDARHHRPTAGRRAAADHADQPRAGTHCQAGIVGQSRVASQ